MQTLGEKSDRLANWLKDTAGIEDFKIIRQLAGGNSNETSLCDSSIGALILRHPPADVISDLAGAGISREYRFTSAISGKAPVAEPVAFCDDRNVIGAPFSVGKFVSGMAITENLPVPYCQDAETTSDVGRAMMEALAQVHNITNIAAELGDSEKAKQFVVRQIDRWRSVRTQSAVRDLPLIESIGDWLSKNAPTPEVIRIVHCDYHLDNLLMDENTPRVNAILDWEMATLGDPMVDVGLVTAMWNRDENQPTGFAFVQRVSNHPNVISGQELAQFWAERTRISIRNLAYFQVFSLWRLAAIVEGAYVLYRNGQVDGAYERGLEYDVPALLDAAKDIVQREGMA